VCGSICVYVWMFGCSLSPFGKKNEKVDYVEAENAQDYHRDLLSVCGSSAPAPSCWDERRWQTSCAAAAAVLLAEWRERGSCITACLHLNPSMALTTALANSFRLREAAAVVASGGDAGDDGGDPPHVRRRAGRDVWRRDLSPSGALRLTTSALPAAGVCGRRRDLGPQGRVAPSGGARQGPIVSYVLQSAAPTGPSP
jgi:hypothetical protein